MWSVVVSLGGPLDKAMFYFYLFSTIFSVLTICSLIGIVASLAATGINPLEKDCRPVSPLPGADCEWHELHGDSHRHISYLTVSGIIMSCVFFIPMFMRPMDFLFHMKGYVIGMLTYVLMLPTFINIMAIYSMCNLHDISWGNRPSAAQAMNAVSAVAKKQ
jgi:hypothetical protein